MAHNGKQEKVAIFFNISKQIGKLNKIAFEQKTIFSQFSSLQINLGHPTTQFLPYSSDRGNCSFEMYSMMLGAGMQDSVLIDSSSTHWLQTPYFIHDKVMSSKFLQANIFMTFE